MEIDELQNCCGVLVISSLHSDYTLRNTREKNYDKRISDRLKGFLEEYAYGDSFDIPRCYIATTNHTQEIAAAALKKLGFRGSKFKGRKNNQLMFWKKTTPLAQHRAMIREKKAEIRRTYL